MGNQQQSRGDYADKRAGVVDVLLNEFLIRYKIVIETLRYEASFLQPAVVVLCLSEGTSKIAVVTAKLRMRMF
jgi:hypothetical protein